MSSPFIEQTIKVRRTIYALGNRVTHSEAQLTALIKDAVKHSPSSFQLPRLPRAVILFGEQHHKLWDIVKAELKKIVRQRLPQSEAKVNGEASLRLRHCAVLRRHRRHRGSAAEVRPLCRQLPHLVRTRHRDRPVRGLDHFGPGGHPGPPLQHYNPLIDQAVRQEWNLPASWLRRAPRCPSAA